MGTHQNAMLNPSAFGQQELVSWVTSNEFDLKKKDTLEKKEGFVGVLEVSIHQARDLQDICIYHKQDVYAKMFLTSNPEATESTQTVNGGGQNPVFNQTLKLNVLNSDFKLRIEIWMLSRIRNYLGDQLLGFALIPHCEIFFENGKLEKEFELSTSEGFHSPSGFVKLSIIYTGLQPDVLDIPTANYLCDQDSVECDQVSCELEKLEFPDPKIMNENEIMVSEYVANGLLDSTDRLISRLPEENLENCSVTNVEIEISPSINSGSLEKKEEISQSQCLVDLITIEPEQNLVQQEIVDMYLKSMKQFTEALAKMNLPDDKRNESPDSWVQDSTGSNGSKGEGPNPKVFYGSRAFF